MISLYESILSGIDNTLERGDIYAVNQDINDPDSKLRSFFNIGFSVETPFNYTKSGKKYILEITTGRADCPCIKIESGDKLTDIITNVNGVISNQLICMGNNSIFDNQLLTPNLTCNHISIIGINTIENMDIIINDGKKAGAGFMCDNYLNRINNCTFETYAITKDYASHRLQFRSIPIFNNVKSNSIQAINIVNQEFASGFAGDKIPFKKIDIWKDKSFDNIFEFGYSLDCTNTAKDITKTVIIKSIKDIKKLVVATDFYSKVYSQIPYIIKPGTKISDFIDVSGFADLRSITISDNKMGMFFYNTRFTGPEAIKSFIPEILKQYNDCGAGYPINKMWNELPTTADGWKVMIFRM